MTSTDARYLAFELWKLLRTGECFSDLRRRYDTFRSLRDGGGAASSQYVRRHRRVMRLGGTLNRARLVLGGRIRRCRQKVNGLAAGSRAGEPWRTEARRRLTPALTDLTDAIQRTMEVHPESGAGPTHTEILGALDRHETDIRECGQFLSDVAAEVQSVTPIDEHSREPRSDQSTGSHPGDDLLRYLADRPDRMAAVIELPDRFRDPNVLTVSDADGLIEFGTRKHCWVGPVGKSELHVEKGWNFSSVIGPYCKSMDEILAEALTSTDDQRIRLHLRLTAKGRIRVARLKTDRMAPVVEPKTKTTETDWRDIQRRLERLRDQGEEYTTQARLAAKLNCSPSTINKAISQSTKLNAWKAEAIARRGNKAPPTSSLTEVHLDNTAQWCEQNPAEAVTLDDPEEVLAHLIQDAEPKVRAKLNAITSKDVQDMTGDQVRKLVGMIRNDPDNYNRVLGRRP